MAITPLDVTVFPALPQATPPTSWSWLYRPPLPLPGLPRWYNGKESTCLCRRHGFDPWVGKKPWRRKWQPNPVFLPGKFHGQRSLLSYSPWGPKRVGPNLAHTHTHTHTHTMRKY